MIRRLALLVLAIAAVAASEPADAARFRDRAREDARKLIAAYVFVAGGSGVVVSEDGLVLTNNHVVDGEVDPAEGAIDVRFPGGEVKKARLLGTDPVGDIALLRILDASGLACAELAPVDALVPGMPVMAVGNPFGLGESDSVPTLTTGVLSTVRIVRDDYTDALQLDAPVNPGNSGGPLFDLRGRVLGINGQIRTVSGMRINSGVGLAICSTQLAAFLPVLRDADGGYAHHTAVPKDLKLVRRADGVYVADAGSTALVAEDRLLAVADRPVASLGGATGLFESLPWRAGATIAVRVRRGEETVTVEVACARRTIPGKPYHGLMVATRDDGRVFIEHVDDDSPAAKAGIRRDDDVVAVGGQPIARKLDWLKALAKLEIGDRLGLKLKRGDEDVAADVLLRLHE